MNINMAKLYRRIDIYKPTRQCVMIYRVFEDLQTGQFHVQNVDYYHPNDTLPDNEAFEKQIKELMFEEPVSKRTKGFDNIESAIEFFDSEFNN